MINCICVYLLNYKNFLCVWNLTEQIKKLNKNINLKKLIDLLLYIYCLLNM